MRTGVHPEGDISRPGLVRQRRQGPGEIITAVVGYHDSSDVYFLKN